ncbi:helix-turn-helix domain-containing protein [Paracoccus seriniphilus]|uniref:Helix-turn-helix domain-containing protein n=1 Tax=Paracoccus seriniphilus TaxID=184748 RepID=A0A239Q1Z9_9RHOB|nr:AraC family transcriptional regulator [Paracoccus seriniphilus]WCR15858.1 AraC family transcriptional regulator ligand-binding domain-containing protein [Paracoccus seriniphilus]SNT76515.1 Helix-turn-helix domain-containing protein [Paracoccus seriniphilus]
MAGTERYKIATHVRLCCNLLGLAPEQVLARCGLDPDYLQTEGRGVDGETYFAIWQAIACESNATDLALTLGQGASRGPFQPALMAFSASPDIYTGLHRLKVFKSLIAPIRLHLSESPTSFVVRFESAGGIAVPDVMCATEIIFFLELARTFTAHHVLPQEVTLPGMDFVTPAYQEYIGAPIRPGRHTVLTFSMQDARRSLISADTDIYRLIAAELNARLRNGDHASAFTDQVREALTDLLPTGHVSAEQVALRLGTSKRSLQRKLKEEGSSFRAVLDQTRAALAMTYLRDRKLSTEETSFLLAYQDPNSFYRAFHDWTGMTPAQARGAMPLKVHHVIERA